MTTTDSDKPPGGTPHQIGLALGKLIAENARERRVQYRKLKEEGKVDQVAVWPSTEQAATAAAQGHDSVNAPKSNGSSSILPDEGHSEQRTAHLLLRVLGLTFVTPLMNLGPEGDPANLVRNDVSVTDALDTVESMLIEQPGTLDHVFASRPDSSSTSHQEPSAFASTTLDLWLCPRMLVAAAVLTLRSCEHLSQLNQDGATSASQSARDQAAQLQASLVKKLKTILKLSLSKANHLDTVRTILDEMIFASVSALAQTGLEPPSHIQREVVPEPDGADGDESVHPFIAFFRQGLQADNCLSTPTKTQKPSGDGIARLWMPEDHTDFSISPPQRKHSRHLLRSLAQALLCISVDVVTSLAHDHPMFLVDLGQTSMHALLTDWQRDLNFGQGPLIPQRSPDVIQRLRFVVAARYLGASSAAIGQINTLSNALISELVYLLHAQDSTSNVSLPETCEALADGLRALRKIDASCCLEAWTQLRRNLSNLVDTISAQSNSESDSPSSGLAASTEALAKQRKRCAVEGLVLLHRVAPPGSTHLLTSTQQPSM